MRLQVRLQMRLARLLWLRRLRRLLLVLGILPRLLDRRALRLRFDSPSSHGRVVLDLANAVLFDQARADVHSAGRMTAE